LPNILLKSKAKHATADGIVSAQNKCERCEMERRQRARERLSEGGDVKNVTDTGLQKRLKTLKTVWLPLNFVIK